MTWDTWQQLIRILLYTAGALLLGGGVADGEAYQAFIGGAVNIGAFFWWWFWERHRAVDARPPAASGEPWNV